MIYERDGSASYGILFALLDDGRRALGQTRDPGVMAAMAEDGFHPGEPVYRACGEALALHIATTVWPLLEAPAAS